MDKDENRRNLISIIILIVILVGVSIFITVDKFLTKSALNKQEDTEEITTGNTEIVEMETDTYTRYNIGDSVNLIDSSSWHVIKTSEKTSSTVTLLNDNITNTYIRSDEANTYLNEVYQKNLKDSLGATSDDIEETRLLSLEDIATITNIVPLEVGVSLESSNMDWLYNKRTLTSYVDSNDLSVLICEKTSNEEAKLCEATTSEIWPVRPVITIDKSYIK